MSILNLRKTTIHTLILSVLLFLSTSIVGAETVEYDGLIEPFEVVDIGAPAEGIVAKVTVDRSSPVKQGQILVQLESSVERAALAKARTMATFDGEIDLQQAQLAFAKRVHQRIKQSRRIPRRRNPANQKGLSAIVLKVQLNGLSGIWRSHDT